MKGTGWCAFNARSRRKAPSLITESCVPGRRAVLHVAPPGFPTLHALSAGAGSGGGAAWYLAPHRPNYTPGFRPEIDGPDSFSVTVFVGFVGFPEGRVARTGVSCSIAIEYPVIWIFTRYGFYSIACARKEGGSIDVNTVMVRARCRSHLSDLQKRLPALAGYEIRMTPGRDYVCRLIVPKRVWAAVLFDLAAEQEWSNFKDEAADFQGDAGCAYVHALHDVWARMAQLQREPERDGHIERNAEGVITNAEELSAADVANEAVLCPACGEKVFAAWPEGWDGHAGWACTIEGATPEERKKNYNARYRRLFR